MTQEGKGSKLVLWSQNILLSFNNIREHFYFNDFAQIQAHFLSYSYILEKKNDLIYIFFKTYEMFGLVSILQLQYLVILCKYYGYDILFLTYKICH